ncbi:MAG: D-alanine--D-alanine ligase A [Bdellovibrionales bacterium GWB1_52_6]|nr:MAG: D-alanine--D-alanine ligase A [Bdellovibrionales bacterium GWB1_52_6]OFZ04730.1 MAG: D-alanine--D-alanine ligase A [Bdellovibrionales bacterium GWA1_52_35]HCM39541.1 D-alanine--D-alanine ligase A [Bdellovibrionales bacterium]
MKPIDNSTGKLRVAVLYGGRSGEHEISLRSAASVIRLLDRKRFEVLPVAIDKTGRWRFVSLSQIVRPDASIPESLPIPADAPLVVMPPNPSQQKSSAGVLLPLESGSSQKPIPFDLVFPVMHGPMCEDGTIQGFLELAEVPYVGCGVLASSAGMDKEISKRLVRDSGIPIVPYISVKSGEWQRDEKYWAEQIAKLGYPVFVKPANLGSSVGIHRVKEPTALKAAMEDAFRYDTKVLVEVAVNAREIELAVLENPEYGKPALVSLPGEVTPTHEFYSYEAKYLDENGAALTIPARLSDAQIEAAQKIARKAFSALECEGLARCDLFIDKNTGEFFFNEVNTIPGFTSISMYPKMWEATGLPYVELLSKLVDLALARHQRKKALVRAR